jgi:OmpA-OmpF porin, OOP family
MRPSPRLPVLSVILPTLVLLVTAAHGAEAGGAPPSRVSMDADGDGISNIVDACPNVAGPSSDNLDLNGCPEKKAEAPPAPSRVVMDADGDHVSDVIDACPNVAGEMSDDLEKNGCPVGKPAISSVPARRIVMDADGDHVSDVIDACPNLAGIISDDLEKNGCPAGAVPTLSVVPERRVVMDADGDHVSDVIDACPNQAGAASEDLAKNGCPTTSSTVVVERRVVMDADKDGISDVVDACVGIPGSASDDLNLNGCPAASSQNAMVVSADICLIEPKTLGCPLAAIRGDQIVTVDGVEFAEGRIQIARDSEATLIQIADLLRNNPHLKVRVEGHTDNRSTQRFNLKLSQRRAYAIMDWLLMHGMEPQRIRAVGVGMARPLESNNTERGRRANRRVEFHLEPLTAPGVR